MFRDVPECSMFLVLSTPRDMFAGCAIGCCSLRQVRENALLRGKFFALLQIARRELF